MGARLVCGQIEQSANRVEETTRCTLRINLFQPRIHVTGTAYITVPPLRSFPEWSGSRSRQDPPPRRNHSPSVQCLFSRVLFFGSPVSLREISSPFLSVSQSVISSMAAALFVQYAQLSICSQTFQDWLSICQLLPTVSPYL